MLFIDTCFVAYLVFVFCLFGCDLFLYFVGLSLIVFECSLTDAVVLCYFVVNLCFSLVLLLSLRLILELVWTVWFVLFGGC